MKKLFYYLLHSMMQLVMRGKSHAFAHNVDDLEVVQKNTLSHIIENLNNVSSKPELGERLSIENFSRLVPCTNYTHWEELIKLQRKGRVKMIDSPVVRYQPTSGSTSHVKHIPYTELFLDELDHAISPWLDSIYRKYPRIKYGSHYWSLSWVPEKKRTGEFEDINDDSQLLSLSKQLIARCTQPVPVGVTTAKTMEDSMFATVTFLAADQALSMISVWSPTFALGLLDKLADQKDRISQVLESGNWLDDRQKNSLKGIKAPKNIKVAKLLKDWDARHSPNFYKALWPRLALVSSWDTAMSQHWAIQLREILSHADFEGKGLWATEGVVTIPYRGEYILAYQSHYYEFRDKDTSEVLPAWGLKKGQQVTPILTSGNGLLRYEMNDLLEVEAFVGKVPALKFKGRMTGVDMVGEKMSPEVAQEALLAITRKHEELTPITLLALTQCNKDKPIYVALIEDLSVDEDVPDIVLSEALSNELNKHFHYELAVDLGQLRDPVCIRSKNAKDIYLSICKERGMMEGDIKIEPLKSCEENKNIMMALSKVKSANSLSSPEKIRYA